MNPNKIAGFERSHWMTAPRPRVLAAESSVRSRGSNLEVKLAPGRAERSTHPVPRWLISPRQCAPPEAGETEQRCQRQQAKRRARTPTATTAATPASA